MELCKNGVTISYSQVTQKYEISYKGYTWVNEGRPPYVVLRKSVGGKYAYTIRTFSSALHKNVSKTKNSITVKYSGFMAFGKCLPFSLICKATITAENTVEFSLSAENESGDIYISSASFPGAFNAKNSDGEAYAVDTMRQGLLMPDGYKKNFTSTFAFAHYLRRINTGDCYLPFWGRVSGKQGFCAIVETPFDASMFSCFGKSMAFLNTVHWRSSLGTLSYERKIRFIFHSDCDYNDIAKDYRNYLKEQGRLVTIGDKISSNPNIKNIVGAPVLHTRIFSNIHPKSGFYKKDGENQKLFASFEKRCEQYKKLKENGLENLYIHTDGWGNKGYDNNHPYVLPPNPQAGGYKGMKELADVCRKLGYVFAVHDQYRDYYYSCPQYDIEKAVTKIDGTHPYCDYWDGGPHTWLCASHALEFVQKTYSELEKNGIDIQGAYLDVFSIVAGDECFHKEHRITREESIRLRGKCFDYLNEKGIIPSSEEPGDLLVDKIALVHHAPYALRPQENGQAVGIPVPLLGLVYHDCIMVPWISKGIGGWGIPDTDLAMLHCILNAGMPYFEPFDENNELLPDLELKSEIDRTRKLCEIQKALFDKEMIKHSFVNGNLRKQRCSYSDGTEIEIDFDSNSYSIKNAESNADISKEKI
ncbi:MAG: DUF5696 domain-containing protein [Oscillospiraceae bacterium]